MVPLRICETKDLAAATAVTPSTVLRATTCTWRMVGCGKVTDLEENDQGRMHPPGVGKKVNLFLSDTLLAADGVGDFS